MSEIQLYYLKDLESAISYAEKAIQLNPTNSDAYLTKGIAEQKASKNELSNISFSESPRAKRQKWSHLLLYGIERIGFLQGYDQCLQSF